LTLLDTNVLIDVKLRQILISARAYTAYTPTLGEPRIEGSQSHGISRTTKLIRIVRSSRVSSSNVKLRHSKTFKETLTIVHF